MRASVQIAVALLCLAGYVLSPVLLIWGWVRWSQQPKLKTLPAILSLLGFTLASASGLLAVAAIALSLVRGGFAYYDPLLMRVFGVGGLLSLGGLIAGVGGVWRAGSLRWHAPVSAVATLAFWIAAAIGE
jgi:O-antigen ligase